jgi:hypothetical protein
VSERAKKSRELKPKEPLPAFGDREEEAAFWDTHSLADYWDEFQPVKVKFAKKLSEGLTIRLDPETLGRLRALAQQKGIGPSTLARMWVLEQLRQERPEHTARTR